ncbi:MAG: DNA methyltransferase, partial [Planctomycetota bacterium]
PTGIVLDFFAGSGTTGEAVIRLNKSQECSRGFLLIEAGPYFDSLLKRRILKALAATMWEAGVPGAVNGTSRAVIQCIRLESYEDALANLELRRTAVQQQLLAGPMPQRREGMSEQFLLRYMLDVETRGSQSLLNVQAFADPTAYKLKVKRPSSDESRETNVDLQETFNWLIGLTVRHMAAPRTFTAAFERDGEGRLQLKGRLKEDPAGPYWFRAITGTMPDGRRTLIVWRKLTGEPEQDNLVLDAWFTKQGYSSKDSEFDVLYVNGGNNLENLRAPDQTWKVRLIEEDFHRLMFATEAV